MSVLSTMRTFIPIAQLMNCQNQHTLLDYFFLQKILGTPLIVAIFVEVGIDYSIPSVSKLTLYSLGILVSFGIAIFCVSRTFPILEISFDISNALCWLNV